MKKLNLNKIIAVALLLLLISPCVNAQDEKKTLLVDVIYHLKLDNNSVPFVEVFTKTKVDRSFLPVANIKTKVFIGDTIAANLLGNVTTDENGKAIVGIPESVKNIWDSSATVSFSAITDANKDYESTVGTASITKGKIEIDTTSDGTTRTIVAKFLALNGKNWEPAKDVEMKIIVKRTIGNLSAGDAETYTTDSTGQVSVDFTKIGIVGDAKGMITIIAKTEDNDTYGNVSLEKQVPWGTPFVAKDEFDLHSLFATRDKAPIWLMLLATSIIIGVWGVLIYLVRQIVTIKKQGKIAVTE
jgi:hypothetical protein